MTGSRTGSVAYLDGFAGPGLYDDGSPGSPALAVETARIIGKVGSIDGYFVEKHRASFDALQSFIADAGLDWRAYHGQVEEHLDAVLARVADAPLFAFLDPFGLGIPLATLKDRLLARAGRMIGNRRRNGGAATEVLLNFSLPGLRRNAGHLTSTSTTQSYVKSRESLLKRVDASLGGDWWRAIWRTVKAPDREQQILDEYVRRLTALPGNWSVWRVPVSDRWQGPPVYFLLLLTQHPDGIWLFNEALSNATEEYRRYCVQLAGQLDLEPIEQRELRWIDHISHNMEILLEGGPFPVRGRMIEVYGAALGFAREKHVRAAVKRLHALGKTESNGVGNVPDMIVKPSTTPPLF